MELNVRVFEFEGNTAISGDVPNDVLVRVKAGNLGVSGFIAGYVLADKNIRIDGNIQGGAAISNKGSITVDHSLMGAALIAKQGGIVCNHVESPECVFAWDSLVVDGPCMDGTVTAGSMRINGRVSAAKLVSCGAIECKSLSVSSRSETIVYLADQIECTAYQRPLEDALDNQFNNIGGWKKKIESYEEADKFTLNLIHNTYRTALFFLLGGIKSASGAANLQGKQLRELYLGQLISVSEAIAKFYGEVHENREEMDEDTVYDFNEDMTKTRERIYKDIKGLPEDFGTSHRRYLMDRSLVLSRMADSVHQEFFDNHEPKTLDGAFAKTISMWRTEYTQTETELRELIQSFGIDKKLLTRIEYDPESLEAMLTGFMDEKNAPGTQTISCV